MCDEEALLAAIEAQPAEDLPKLAYADWLQEHGRLADAELIHIRHQLSKLPPRPLVVAASIAEQTGDANKDIGWWLLAGNRIRVLSPLVHTPLIRSAMQAEIWVAGYFLCYCVTDELRLHAEYREGSYGAWDRLTLEFTAVIAEALPHQIERRRLMEREQLLCHSCLSSRPIHFPSA